MSLVKYCIFDMDGLLLDTERIYSEVTQKIVEPFGKVYTWEIKSQMMGKRQMEAAELLVKTLELPISPQEYLDQRNKMQNELFHSARPLPGVERLIKHLKKHEIPIAVATSSHFQEFKLKTSENRYLFDMFSVVVTGDDPAVANGKPSPDIFLEAARRLKVPADEHENCLVFEDAPAGVHAGNAAGMRVCWVPDENCVRDGVSADLVLTSLEQFDPAAWGLPTFE